MNFYCTADIVSAKQRTLRPTQNFNAINVNKINYRSNSARDDNIVNVKAYAVVNGTEKVALPYTSNIDSRNRRRSASNRVVLIIHVRRNFSDF